jgi:hypothetical protein
MLQLNYFKFAFLSFFSDNQYPDLDVGKGRSRVIDGRRRVI